MMQRCATCGQEWWAGDNTSAIPIHVCGLVSGSLGPTRAPNPMDPLALSCEVESVKKKLEDAQAENAQLRDQMEKLEREHAALEAALRTEDGEIAAHLIADAHEIAGIANLQNHELRTALEMAHEGYCSHNCPAAAHPDGVHESGCQDIAHVLKVSDKPVNEQCWYAAKAEAKDAVCPIHDAKKPKCEHLWSGGKMVCSRCGAIEDRYTFEKPNQENAVCMNCLRDDRSCDEHGKPIGQSRTEKRKEGSYIAPPSVSSPLPPTDKRNHEVCPECDHDDVTLGSCQVLIVDGKPKWGKLHCHDCCKKPQDWE